MFVFHALRSPMSNNLSDLWMDYCCLLGKWNMKSFLYSHLFLVTGDIPLPHHHTIYSFYELHILFSVEWQLLLQRCCLKLSSYIFKHFLLRKCFTKIKDVAGEIFATTLHWFVGTPGMVFIQLNFRHVKL